MPPENPRPPLPPVASLAAGVCVGAVLPWGALPSGALAWTLGLALGALALVLGAASWRRWVQHGVLLTLGALAAHPVAAPRESNTPRLMTGSGTVVRERFHGHRQFVDVAWTGLGRRVTDAPANPKLVIGDLVSGAGLVVTETWYGRQREKVILTRLDGHVPREQGPRGAAWRALSLTTAHPGLSEALILGQGRSEHHRDFRRSGLLHMLAVSGLHLGLVVAGLALVTQALQIPWGTRLGVLGLGCVGYLWLTGGNLATWRATAMALVFMAAWRFGRETPGMAILAVAVLVLALLDPSHLLRPGFHLSVGAVAGILTLGLDLVAARKRIWPLNPWPLDRPLWRGVLFMARWSLDLLAIGFAASLATAPIIAFHFEQATPYGALASLIATPFLMLALGSGLILVCLGSLWPQGPWNGIVWLHEAGLDGLLAVATTTANTPGAYLRIEPPSPLALVLTPLLFWRLAHPVEVPLRALAILGWLMLW